MLANIVLNLTKVACLSFSVDDITELNLTEVIFLSLVATYINLWLSKLINDINVTIKLAIKLDNIVKDLLILLPNMIPQFTAFVNTFTQILDKDVVIVDTTLKIL